MKRMFLFLPASIFIHFAYGQEIKVNPYIENGRKGYEVVLESESEKVDAFIPTFFKGNGKVRQRGETYNITNISRADFPFPEVLVLTEVKPENKRAKAVVWIADSLMEQEVYSNKLGELWYSFGLEFYRDLAQKDIDESLQALRYAEKQYQKLDRDSLGLQNDIKNNEEEKIKLEEALKTNELNYKVINQKILNNAAAKDSVLIAIDKIKKLIEIQEEKKKAIY